MKTLSLMTALAAILGIGCGSQGDQQLNQQDLSASCGEVTLNEIYNAQNLSPDCREAVQDYLDTMSDDLHERVFALGSEDIDSGRRYYVSGIDADGEALNADSDLIVTMNGRSLGEDEYTVSRVADGDGRPFAISLVTDYSGSMRDDDIDLTSDLYEDLITNIDGSYVAEASIFSSSVERQQVFTHDRDEISDGIDRNNSFAREDTALYDGMGSALSSLTARSEPARIMVVSTDGLENASTMHSRRSLLTTINDNKVVVLMLGSLFADTAELKELHGKRGAFVYARAIDDVKQIGLAFGRSLKDALVVEVAGASSDDEIVVSTSYGKAEM